VLPRFLAQSPEVASGLVQYGAIGLLALIALLAVRVLFQREIRAHDLERARADRLEGELRKLNEHVAREVVPTLIRATGVIGKILDERKDWGHD
jgi:hypothetical protein